MFGFAKDFPDKGLDISSLMVSIGSNLVSLFFQRGYKYYILKYDNESDMFPYARLEYAYYKICCDARIRMKHSELRRFENSSHFITERFNRNPDWNWLTIEEGVEVTQIPIQ